jgi:GT2 family glycosyltransferase
MKVAAITITFNRLELTKRTVESFYSKTNVDYHLFIDNGSTDGTQDFVKQFDHILLDRNFGIAYALATAVKSLEDFDYVLKLDNDIEVVTDDIVNRMLDFHLRSGDKYVCSPVDLLLDKNFAPPVLWKGKLNSFHVEHVSHTGGAFQLMPQQVCRELCKEYRSLAKGDYMIGHYYRRKGYKPTYLTELQIKHIGLNQSCQNYKL